MGTAHRSPCLAIYEYMCVCVCVCLHVYVCLFARVCVCVCVYVCACVYSAFESLDTYTHTHTHTHTTTHTQAHGEYHSKAEPVEGNVFYAKSSADRQSLGWCVCVCVCLGGGGFKDGFFTTAGIRFRVVLEIIGATFTDVRVCVFTYTRVSTHILIKNAYKYAHSKSKYAHSKT